MLVAAMSALMAIAEPTEVMGLQEQSAEFMLGFKATGSDSGWSLFANTAGLAFVDAPQIVGGYTYELQREQLAEHRGQLGITFRLLDQFAFGFGLQLALPQVQTDPAMGSLAGTLGVAFRPTDWISFGLNAVKQRHYADAQSEPFKLGFGVEARPTSWLSVGADIRQVYDAVWSYPEIRAGLAVTLFANKLKLIGESRFVPRSANGGPDFLIHPEVGARLGVGVISFSASAQVFDVGQGVSTPIIFAGIDFDLDHFSFGSISRFKPSHLAGIGGRFSLTGETLTSVSKEQL